MNLTGLEFRCQLSYIASGGSGENMFLPFPTFRGCLDPFHLQSQQWKSKSFRHRHHLTLTPLPSASVIEEPCDYAELIPILRLAGWQP